MRVRPARLAPEVEKAEDLPVGGAGADPGVRPGDDAALGALREQGLQAGEGLAALAGPVVLQSGPVAPVGDDGEVEVLGAAEQAAGLPDPGDCDKEPVQMGRRGATGSPPAPRPRKNSAPRPSHTALRARQASEWMVDTASRYGEVALTTAEMQSGEPFEGWSTEAWVFTEGLYPRLIAFIPLYTVRWLAEDGETPLEQKLVAEFDTPVYDGETPEKAEDTYNTYVFSGWTPEVVPAVADADYAATFETVPKGTGSGTLADPYELLGPERIAEIIALDGGATAEMYVKTGGNVTEATLDNLTADYTAADGDELVGTTTHNVTIPGGAAVTVNGIPIAAERAGTAEFWTEDLNAGQRYAGILVRNPFAEG